MNKYGLIGSNLSYSYSKQIHEKLYENYNLNCKYDLIETTQEKLEVIINKLKTKEYLGFNITIPFKEEVLKYVDVMSKEVAEIKSCNTLKFENGKIVAYNTDVFGFEFLLKYNNINLNKTYILGSGGTSKTVSNVLTNNKIDHTIISRSNQLYNYEHLENNIKGASIVNTTPVGTFPTKESILTKEVAQEANIIIDLIYNPSKTLLMSYNNNSYNGLPMLVYQAVKAFEIWTNCIVDNLIVNKIIKEIEVV